MPRESEAQYFRQRREYDAVSACCGVGVLAERLNKVLAKRHPGQSPERAPGVGEGAGQEEAREPDVWGGAWFGLFWFSLFSIGGSFGGVRWRSVAFGGVRWRSVAFEATSSLT